MDDLARKRASLWRPQPVDVARHARRTGPRARGRLGKQRPAMRLGNDPRGVPRAVARDDHPPRHRWKPLAHNVGRRAHIDGPRESGLDSARLGPRPAVRPERLAELDIHVHGASGRARLVARRVAGRQRRRSRGQSCRASWWLAFRGSRDVC